MNSPRHGAVPDDSGLAAEQERAAAQIAENSARIAAESRAEVARQEAAAANRATAAAKAEADAATAALLREQEARIAAERAAEDTERDRDRAARIAADAATAAAAPVTNPPRSYQIWRWHELSEERRRQNQGILAAIIIVGLVLLLLFCCIGGIPVLRSYLAQPVATATTPVPVPSPYASPYASPVPQAPATQTAPVAPVPAGIPGTWVKITQADLNKLCAAHYGAGSTAGRLPGSDEWPAYQLRCDGDAGKQLSLTEDICQRTYGPNSYAENPRRAQKNESEHPWDFWFCVH